MDESAPASRRTSAIALPVEFEIRDERVMVGGWRRHDRVAHPSQGSVVENVIEDVRSPAPRHLVLLYRGVSKPGKLRDERFVFGHVEIAAENRRAG